MSLQNISDDDLRARLTNFGITSPITNSTKNVLIKKLAKLEMESLNNGAQSSDGELMDTSSSDMNEYEIKDNLSKLGCGEIPITDTTRITLSNFIRKKKKN